MTKKFNITDKLDVQYCVPEWLKIEQIKSACARPLPRIQPSSEARSEPIAIVGFGPSLADTWEHVRNYPYVMTCSGSHKFLIERGIVPNWHVEVDPREHKVKLLGQPHASVEYLVASTCCPKYFDHLDGYQVRLWHVFDLSDDGHRVLPPDEWAVTGGCDVGLRCLTLAGFLGFRDLHVFGLDGNARESGRHAAEHPNGVMQYGEADYGGKTYKTTTGMLEAARQVFHELNMMPGVKATFYGEGLIQAMAKDYVPKPIEARKEFPKMVGHKKPELISSEYREMNAQLHRNNLAYGVGGAKHVDTVVQLMDLLATRSVLDYGCGKSLLGGELAKRGIPIFEYDPAIPNKSESPRPADLVICTDVLEHIEPEKLHAVLSDLQRCVRKLGYFVVHTGPAGKTLPDGRNTHLIQQGRRWWKEQLRKHFHVPPEAVIESGPHLYIVVEPKRLDASEYQISAESAAIKTLCEAAA